MEPRQCPGGAGTELVLVVGAEGRASHSPDVPLLPRPSCWSPLSPCPAAVSVLGSCSWLSWLSPLSLTPSLQHGPSEQQDLSHGSARNPPSSRARMLRAAQKKREL